MKRPVGIAIGLLTAVALAVFTMPVAEGCPFCQAPSLTLSEQLPQSDAVALVEWIEAVQPEGQTTAGSTTYEIVQVVKQPAESGGKGNVGGKEKAASAAISTQAPITSDSTSSPANASATPAVPLTLKKGDRIVLTRYRAGKKGDLFLLMGTKGVGIEWGSPLEVTETSFNYIIQAPSPEKPAQERLKYFLKFLEFSDRLVADDAFAELANAPYKDIAPLADVLPHEKVREWVLNPNTQPTRLGLYGLLLGLCGKQEDAPLMAEKISQQTEEFRLGMDGVASGYLLLTGDKGLDLLDQTKLKNTKAAFSETYAAMQALRFMWTYAQGRIDKERLRGSMRILLDRPELADLVIADLARWEDWSIQDRLMQLYGAADYNVPSIKRAIVRYMLVSSKSKAKDDKNDAPAHVKKGQQYLEKLRQQDPKTVADAERFFFLN